MESQEAVKQHFHMVTAEVVFMTKRGGITSLRVQFMTQSVTDQFPAPRLDQLQNTAAAIVRQKLDPKDMASYKVHDVLFLNFLYCGHFSSQEFYGVEFENQVAVDETPVVNNVIPFDSN